VEVEPRGRAFDDEAVALYAESQPTFGGIYRDRSRLVVMFTADLEQRRRAISRLLPRRGHVVIRQASRSWAGVELANDRAARRVMQGDEAEVTSVGIGLDGDQFAIFVEVYPYSEATAERVRGLAAPDDVIIEPGGGRPVPAERLLRPRR
jgi:hypothetical protein